MKLWEMLGGLFGGRGGARASAGRGRERKPQVEFLEDRCVAAVAPVLVSGASAGVFVNPSAGVVSGVGTSHFAWGTPTSTGPGRSRFDFSPSSFSLPAGEVISLGRLDYFNGETTPGTAVSSVGLQVSVTLAGAAPLTFTYPLHITTTTNTDDPVASADRVSLEGAAFPLLQVQVPGGRTFTLQVLGFGRAAGEGFIRNRGLNVEEGGSASAELLAQVRAPGIYVAARDLAGAAFLGTHQFLVLVPQNPRRFRGKLRDLGDGTRGIVIGAHNVGGRLRVKRFERSDFQAARQYFNPGQFVQLLTPDFDTEFDLVDLSRSRWKSIDGAIAAVLRAVERYEVNEARRPIRYPSFSGQFRRNCINSNSWAQSVIQFVAGSGAVREDFSGLDTCHQNRISRSYFR